MAAQLVLPHIGLQKSFLEAISEYHKEERALDLDEIDLKKNFESFLQKFKDESEGKNLKPGRLPATVYWLVEDGEYIGDTSIRHFLDKNLSKVGGHIGYKIRPSKRGKGYGKKILELALPKARELGIKDVLMTCNLINIASRKVIEENGGILENEVPGEPGKPNKLRFWIKK